MDNHADGPYLWMRLKREDPKRAEEVFHLLQYNEGNNSGRGIGCISWDGKVSADQFWRQHVFGNVLERPFSEIWDDPNIELLHKMKNKKLYVKGRCHQCQFLNICGRATSAPAPKPFTVTSGLRIRPATSLTRKSASSSRLSPLF